jgi:hypothetical protein
MRPSRATLQRTKQLGLQRPMYLHVLQDFNHLLKLILPSRTKSFSVEYLRLLLTAIQRLRNRSVKPSQTCSTCHKQMCTTLKHLFLHRQLRATAVVNFPAEAWVLSVPAL